MREEKVLWLHIAVDDLVAAYAMSVPDFAEQHTLYEYQALRSGIHHVSIGLRVAAYAFVSTGHRIGRA
eukprot:2054439-Rhodomonas_salina.2